MNNIVLVNKENKIEDSYLDAISLVKVEEEKFLVEKEAALAYLKLKEYLLNKGITICISSAYRSMERQQEIYDEFVVRYGKEYADKTVAPVGCSEHHTALALDIDIMVDGKFLIGNHELMKHEDIYLEIHKHISKFGFILRYMKDKESITGYPYEPWHIRYVGDVAEYIYKENLTLEEYLLKKD